MRSLTVDINVINPIVGDQFGFEVTNDGIPLVFTQSGQPDSIGWKKTYITTVDTRETIPANRIVKLNSDLTYRSESSLFSKFNNSAVLDLLIKNTGFSYAVGAFTLYNNTIVNRFVGFTDTGNSQSQGTAFNADVITIKELSDGSLLFGGVFTSFGAFQVNRLFKRFANGLVDTTFNNNIMSASTNKGFNGSVNTIAIQSDGRILVGGSFNIFNNNTRSRIVRLNANGTIDNTFVVGTGFGNGFVNSIAIQPDGKILVGGSFETYKGVPVGQLVRLDAVGNLDTAFNIAIGNGTNFGRVNIIKVHNNEIYVGGKFSAFNGNPTKSIVKLSLTAAVISLFGGGFGNSTDLPTLLGSISDIDFLADNSILVGGTFDSYNGTSVKNFAKINTDGSLSSNRIDFNDSVYKIAVNSGFIYVAGGFTTTTIGALIPGVSNLYNIPIAATNSRVDDVYATYDNLVEFNTNPYGVTYSIIFGTVSSYDGIQPDYSNIISAEYDTVSGVFADRIDNSKTYIMSNGIITDGSKLFFRITASGSIDPTFTPFFSTQPNQAYQLNNGQIIVNTSNSGFFNSFIYKLNYDGSQNLTFNHTPPAPFDTTIVGNNNFTYAISASGTASIKRYNNTNGTLSSTFSEVKIKYTTGSSTPLYGYRVQSDDKLLVLTGLTSSIIAGGVTYSNRPVSVYRFNNNGSLDTTYTLGATLRNVAFYSTYLTRNDKLLLSDYSATYSRIRRFNTNGSLDTTFTFNGTLNGPYLIQSEQSDGKLVVMQVYGNPTKVVRLNTDGSLDTTYNAYLDGAIVDVSPAITGYNNDELFIYSGYVKSGSGLLPPVKLTKDGDYITNGINFCNTTPDDFYTMVAAIQPDDKAIIYTKYGFSGTSSALIRINPNGTLDNSFNYLFNTMVAYTVETICILSSGKILIGNDNTPNIRRFNIDGSEDLTYNYIDQGLGDWVTYTEELSNNFVYIGNPNMINKITSTGSYTPYGFNGGGVYPAASISNVFKSIVKQSDDKILFSISATASIRANGGTFSKGPGIYRLNTDGSFDNTFIQFYNQTFRPSPNGGLALQLDGKVLCIYTNGSQDFLFRFNINGSIDNSYASDTVYIDNSTYGGVKLLIQSDNKVVLYATDEALMNVPGVLDNPVSILRLNTDGGFDETFNTQSNNIGALITASNYSNNDMLVLGYQTTWPQFQATGRGNITRITKDANEVFYLDTPVDEVYQETGVRMKYDFDTDEVVFNNVYDTPNHLEITYINTSLTINDLINEIVVRSPHLIISTQSSFDTANYQVRVWEGSIFNGPSQSVLYDITKQKLFLGQDNVYVNINNLVREKLEANVGNFMSQDYDFAKPLSENMSKWVQVNENLTNAGATVSTTIYRMFATDGYLHNNEIQEIPNVLITGAQRYIHKDQLQRIYFQTNFLTRIEVRFADGFGDYDAYWNVDLLGDNKNYVQSLIVDTRYFEYDNQWVEYRFEYSNSATEVVRFNIYNYCKFDPYTLVFKNKWGVLESVGLTKKSSKKLETTNVDFERSILDYNGSYDINRHTKKQFNVTGNESWTLNTDWMPEYMNQALEEINLSEEIWLLDRNNEPVPVTIEDNSIDYKTEVNDKLIQYTIKVKLSHSTIKNII